MPWVQRMADWLWSPSNLTPHGFCLLWEPGLIWTHVFADSAIALAYFSIPAALTVYIRRRNDLAFGPVPWLFAAFILLCGAGHLMDLATLWVPIYGIEGMVKVATALVSILTAVTLWRLMPQALALPSPRQLHDAHNALNDSEQLRRALFEHSPAPMMTQDVTGQITGVSQSWLDLFGYARGQVVGHRLDAFQAAPADPADWQHLLDTGQSPGLERRLLAQSGQAHDVLLKARVMHSGGARWVVTVITDITARRQAEEALRTAEERLRQSQKMEAIGQLTGGIAHDFNNALTAVTGNLERILARVPGNRADLTASAETALKAANRAGSLTAQLLSFSRRQRLESKPLDPANVAAKLRPLLEQTVGARITLAITGPDTPILCLADRNQLESAILNLVINARDAIDGTGTITVAIDAAEPPEGLPDGSYVRITVADTGTGMAEEVRQRVFEPFFTTKPQGQGTGLGLSQIHGFALQSGGTVTVHSTPGAGSRFAILLPRVQASTAAPEPEPAHPSPHCPPGHGERLLLVEDDDLVRATFTDMLADLGYETVESVNADAAITLMDDSRISAVLTDLTMPGSMNGLEFAAIVQRRRPGLPILLLTGHLDPFRGRDIPHGVQFVQKPFDRQHLARLLYAALAEAHPLVPAAP